MKTILWMKSIVHLFNMNIVDYVRLSCAEIVLICNGLNLDWTYTRNIYHIYNKPVLYICETF